VDGNKRVGAAAALVFLQIDGILVKISDQALVNNVLAVVRGKLQKGPLAEFFRRHARG
jgi:death-on-curing protein